MLGVDAAAAAIGEVQYTGTRRYAQELAQASKQASKHHEPAMLWLG